MCEKCDCLCVRSICLCAQDYYLYVKSVWFCSFNSSLCVRLTYTCVIFSCLCVRLSQPCVDFSYSCSAVLCFLALRLTVCVALVADCGRISFQTVRWLMRETNLAERASPAINATQCYRQLLFFFFTIIILQLSFLYLQFNVANLQFVIS